MTWHKFEQSFPVMAGALKQSRKNQMMAHAFLVYADQDDVREYVPIALAQLRLCLNLGADATPCGACRHCLALMHGSYPEFFALAPVSKSRQIRIGEDRYDVDTMRWFEAQFYFTAETDHDVKVGVIRDAECLNEQAQNAFLKTLEEPPRQTFFILVTSAPYQLLPTIRSRCQMISLLSNRINYNQSFAVPLMDILLRLEMVSPDDLPSAERVAEEIIAMAQTLKGEAESLELPLWEQRFEEMKQLEWSATERKSIEQRRDAAIQARYLMLRNSFLSLIYDFFAVAWQESLGIHSEEVNPEIRVHLSQLQSLSESRLLAQLRCAEQLLRDLKYNVNEELALRVFTLNCAAVSNV